MKKGLFFVTALLLLAIGSGFSVYGMIQQTQDVTISYHDKNQIIELDFQKTIEATEKQDATKSSHHVYTQSGRCIRCGGRGVLTCMGPFGLGCPRDTDGCSRCGNSGIVRCNGTLFRSCTAGSRR